MTKYEWMRVGRFAGMVMLSATIGASLPSFLGLLFVIGLALYVECRQ